LRYQLINPYSETLSSDIWLSNR